MKNLSIYTNYMHSLQLLTASIIKLLKIRYSYMPSKNIGKQKFAFFAGKYISALSKF